MTKPINTTPKFHRHFTEYSVAELFSNYVSQGEKYCHMMCKDQLKKIYLHIYHSPISEEDKKKVSEAIVKYT